MERRNTAMGGGCALALLGVFTALSVWITSRRTDRHLGGGFEGEGQDLSVLWTELPLTLLAGAVIPGAAWVLTLRLANGRPGSPVALAAACAAGALALTAWGLHTWANPDPAPATLRMSGAPASHLHP